MRVHGALLLRALVILLLAAVVLGVAHGGSVAAGEIDHYVPAVNNVRDFLLPDKGVYGALYTLYYRTDDFRNRNGNSVDSVRVAGRDVRIDVDLDLFSILPLVIWSSGFKILGAEYGGYAAIPFGGPSIQAAVNLTSELGLEAEQSSFGLQDIYVQPLWLAWRWPEVADLSLAYGFYAPTGRFEQGATDNLGLGFWTQQFQAAGAYYLNKKATAFVLAGTFELNSNKEDVDVTPGAHFTLDYGASQFLPLEGNLLELGLRGYSSWQVTDDSGSDARNKDVHDQVHGIGLQLGYTIPKWRLSLTAKYIYEYYAVDRFRGQAATLSAAFKF